MVIRGNSRGNARQLSHYLLAKKDNEAIRILDVDGQVDPDAKDLHQAIFLMGVSAELTKSDKGLYHAQINPAIGEDSAMGDDNWLQAADILGRQLGLINQRRAIVLHTKKGRTHAHVVWERYDHEKGKMVSDSFSRLAQDRARKEMEATFGQQPTPHRNKHRPELKASLSAIWHQTGTGAQFVKAARKNGYIISEGSGRSPYMVVDENGRSYDLTRQLQGVRLKDVRQRLRHESLMGEKDAIAFMRKNNGNQEQGGNRGTGKQKASLTHKYNTMQDEFATNNNDITADNHQQDKPTTKDQFRDNKADISQADNANQPQPSLKERLAASRQEITGQQPDKTVREKFAENKSDTTGQSDKEKRREAFRQRMQPKPDNERTKERGLDMD